MVRVNALIEKMMIEQGKGVAQDYGSIEGLTRIFEVFIGTQVLFYYYSESLVYGFYNFTSIKIIRCRTAKC